MAPGASGRSLTLLHLSDLQFGREHAFGGRARLPEDGRFDTLTRVVDFYNTGVQAHPNLDPRLRTSPTGPITPRRLGLSGAEVQSIVAFLGTLTDDALRTDHKFADPFRVPTRR
mgnify:CR=1 FL=1